MYVCRRWRLRPTRSLDWKINSHPAESDEGGLSILSPHGSFFLFFFLSFFFHSFFFFSFYELAAGFSAYYSLSQLHQVSLPSSHSLWHPHLLRHNRSHSCTHGSVSLELLKISFHYSFHHSLLLIFDSSFSVPPTNSYQCDSFRARKYRFDRWNWEFFFLLNKFSFYYFEKIIFVLPIIWWNRVKCQW